MLQNKKKIITIFEKNNLFEVLKASKFEKNTGKLIFFYIHELSPTFKKNIAFKILKLNQILFKYNLIYDLSNLKKIYFKNNGSFVFNFENIKLSSDYNSFYIDFFSYFIGPLLLLNYNYDYIKYKKFHDYLSIGEFNLIVPSNFYKVLIFFRKNNLFNEIISKIIVRLYGDNNLSIFFKFNKFVFFYKYLFKRKDLSNNFYYNLFNKYYYNQLLKIEFDIKLKWTDYYRNKSIIKLLNTNNIEDELNNSRDIKINEVLKKFSYLKSIHDLGANAGYYSILAYKSGFKNIISSDTDYGAIDNFYKFVNKNFLDIYCIISNFTKISKEEILNKKTDVVLALGFTHHMRLVELMSWETIAEKLSLYSNKILITEFKNDTKAANINSNLTQNIIDYDLNSFMKSLNLYFKKCEIIGDYSISADKGVRTDRKSVV